MAKFRISAGECVGISQRGWEGLVFRQLARFPGFVTPSIHRNAEEIWPGAFGWRKSNIPKELDLCHGGTPRNEAGGEATTASISTIKG
jgi:hypothetical protein